MKRSTATRIAITATAAALIALASIASTASAAGFTLSLTASSAPVVGKPLILTATGTTPVEDLEFPYFFSLDAIPTRVATTCPAERWVAVQFASNGGSVVVLTQSEHPDAAGNFSIPVVVTPWAPGAFLLCAYTDDGAAATLAAASLTVNVQAKSSSTAARPTVATISADARGGVRSCLALLGPKDSAGCLRSVVRRANTACRRLHSRSGRTSCLHAVRKIARR